MASPTMPDGFTGPDDSDFEYAWLASGQRRGYDGSKDRDRSVDEALDGDPNHPDLTS